MGAPGDDAVVPDGMTVVSTRVWSRCRLADVARRDWRHSTVKRPAAARRGYGARRRSMRAAAGRGASMSAAPTDQDLSSLLRVVQGGDDADSLLDNGAIASLLGLSQETVAEQLAAAKERNLVGGSAMGRGRHRGSPTSSSPSRVGASSPSTLHRADARLPPVRSTVRRRPAACRPWMRPPWPGPRSGRCARSRTR